MSEAAQKDEKKQEKNNESSSEPIITKDWTIGDVITKYPSLAMVLLDEGVHCVGCGAAHWETIEQGLMGHGKTPEDVERIVKKMNDEIPKTEGKSDELMITEKAAAQVTEYIEKHDKTSIGLRIKVAPGGCSGFQYEFDLEHAEKEGDNVIEVAGVKFFLDAPSMEMLKGATIDYVDSLQGSGFKISNPNAQTTCGCGQSFS